MMVDVQEGNLAALLAQREQHRFDQLGRLDAVVEVGGVQKTDRVLAVRVVGQLARVEVAEGPAVPYELPDQEVAHHNLEHVVREQQLAQIVRFAIAHVAVGDG